MRIGSPVGPLTLVAGDFGLRAVRFAAETVPGGALDGEHPVLAAAAGQLRAYFARERTTFELPLELIGTPFQRRAWLALAEIPYGATVSYGQQARRLGRPGAARAVGAANGRNPVPIVLPCHRLVAADGSLAGYGGGLAVKRGLLEHEAATATAAGAGAAGSSRTRRSPARPRRT